MKTLRFNLTDTWQQVADASGVVTLQSVQGVCYLYVGDAAPTANSPWLVVNDTLTLAATVKGWIKGTGVAVAITV